MDPISRIRERKILEMGRPLKRVTAQIMGSDFPVGAEKGEKVESWHRGGRI